jgi:hypothetical protein
MLSTVLNTKNAMVKKQTKFTLSSYLLWRKQVGKGMKWEWGVTVKK